MPCSRFAVCLGLCLAVLAGCSSKRPGEMPVYPVKGRLTYNGAPMSFAIVTFFTAGEQLETARKSRAYADQDGQYALTTYDPTDGAPTGEYSVLVWWPESAVDPNDDQGNVPDKLKFVYHDPKKPKLKFIVKPEPNTIDINLP